MDYVSNTTKAHLAHFLEHMTGRLDVYWTSQVKAAKLAKTLSYLEELRDSSYKWTIKHERKGVNWLVRVNKLQKAREVPLRKRPDPWPPRSKS